MSDVKAIRYLLANNAGLLAVVPAARIIKGTIPQGTTLPALSVSHVSTVRRKNVAGSVVKFCTSRVQITVDAPTYALQKSVLALVRAALPLTRGTIDGVAVDSIHHELDGPDFSDDASGVYAESVDYMITYTE